MTEITNISGKHDKHFNSIIKKLGSVKDTGGIHSELCGEAAEVIKSLIMERNLWVGIANENGILINDPPKTGKVKQTLA